MNYLRLGFWGCVILTALAWFLVGYFFWNGQPDEAWNRVLWALLGHGGIALYWSELRPRER